jgi:ParB family transcriptional regulator, chromosome partitioning protein
MARRSGLGRGLDALIPTDAGSDDAVGDRLVEIPVNMIVPNRHQPRVHFDEATLEDLAASIAAIGVLQPVLVRSLPDGHYELIAGERRWRASMRAGLAGIPAVVRTSDEQSSMEQALVENLHRQDLTPLEEAAAYNQLVEDFGLTHDAVAERVGKSRPSITNTMRLLSLPAAVQQLLADGRLSAGHARALLGTGDRSFQEQLARRAADEGWTVRAVENAVRDRERSTTGDTITTETASRARSTSQRPAAALEVENLLADRLSTRVNVSVGASRGKLVIEFADLADLGRIYALLTPGDIVADETDTP